MRARLLSAVLLCLGPGPLFAAGEWIEQGDSFDRQFQSAKALQAYLEAEKLRPDDPVLLRKIAKQYVELVIDANGKSEQGSLAQKGYDYALKAKQLAPDDPEARLTVAIAAGRLAFYKDPRGRLEFSQVVKREAAEALRLAPRYALAWHVQGRWHYELSNLNPLLRVVAEAVYGKLPPASNEEAIRSLDRAVQLEPGNAIFHAELGRAYLAAGRRDEARRELEKSLSLPRRNRDDAGAQDRAKQALRSL